VAATCYQLVVQRRAAVQRRGRRPAAVLDQRPVVVTGAIVPLRPWPEESNPATSPLDLSLPP